jgi:hypothetical protein
LNDIEISIEALHYCHEFGPGMWRKIGSVERYRLSTSQLACGMIMENSVSGVALWLVIEGAGKLVQTNLVHLSTPELRMSFEKEFH